MAWANGFVQTGKYWLRTLMKTTVGARSMRLIPVYVDEYIDPIAGATNLVIASGFPTAATPVTKTTGFNGTSGAGPYSPPRNITITLSNSADYDLGTAVVTGTDLNGAVMTEDFTIPDAGNTTVTGNKAFRTVTSILFPAGAGTGGSTTVGLGNKLGLTQKSKTRGGTVAVLSELANGAQVVNGTFATAAVGAPNGTYSPNSTPNATLDYVVTYELADES